MDKFVTRKTQKETKVDGLVDHLKAKAPKVLNRKRRISYSSKPWVDWDDKRREAAALLFLQKSRKPCILQYGGASCPSRSTLELGNVFRDAGKDQSRRPPSHLD